jgi:GT2 family glycosyltransferase
MNPDTPLISIVIVNYNAGLLLRKVVESVERQTLGAFELLIIDNASKDDSLSSVADGGLLGDRFRIIRNLQNTGFAAGQNQGFRLGRGRYCMSLNFDVVLSPDYLQKALAVMEAIPRLGMLSGKLLRMTSEGEPTLSIDNAGLLLPRHRRPVHRGG